MKRETSDFELKMPKTKLGKNISRVIGVTEEITKMGLIPICLMGFKMPTKDKKVNCVFATLSDDGGIEKSVLFMCESLLKSKGYIVTKKDE